MALLSSRPRQATFTATGPTVCGVVSRRMFRRLVGDARSVMMRDAVAFKRYMTLKL